MKHMEYAIRKIAEVYDLEIPFAPGVIQTRLESLRQVTEVRFEILGEGEHPLILYRFTPGIFDGRVDLIVPIREELADIDLSCRISADLCAPALPSTRVGWTQTSKTWVEGDQLCGRGFSLMADRSLRSRGVVVHYDDLKGWGLVHSGDRLFFRRSWVKDLVREPGRDVGFLPVAQVGKGIQAREVSALQI